MSVGFIMYEIVDMDSLKYQGINTYNLGGMNIGGLDIHLNIKALTPRKSEYDEFQPFITKN